jgi:hypothetical protein
VSLFLWVSAAVYLCAGLGVLFQTNRACEGGSASRRRGSCRLDCSMVRASLPPRFSTVGLMVAVATCFEPTPVGVNVWSFIQRCLILLRNRARVGRGYGLVAGVIYPRFRVCSVPHHATDVRPWVPCLPPGGKGFVSCGVIMA